MIAVTVRHTRKIRFGLAALALATMASVLGIVLKPSENSEPDPLGSAQQQGSATVLPTPDEHWSGDLDAMIKRRQVRALVVYSRSAFFYDQGRPEGISYEALQDFNEH